MIKFLSVLGSVGLTASSSNLAMVAAKDDIAEVVDISDWTFDDRVYIDVTGATLENITKTVWARLAEHYKDNVEYRKFFLKIAMDNEAFDIIGSNFIVPTKNDPQSYDLTIMPNDSSGYTGVNFFNITLEISNLNDIQGNIDYFEGEEIGSNWSTNNQWDAANNNSNFELFNFKNYALSWGTFQLNYANLNMNISGTQWKGWNDDNWNVPDSNISVPLSMIDPNNGYVVTIADWSDGSIEGSAQVTIRFTFRCNDETGDVTVSPYIYLKVLHLGAGWKYVTGELALNSWSIEE